MTCQAATAPQFQEKASARARVLLVEDNPHVREPLVHLLDAWGYEVESAADGMEALEKVEAFNPAVVVSDLRMPRLNGAQLVRELRVRRPGLGYILYSGGRLDEQDLAGLDDVCFLQKPFDPSRLRDKIRKCLEQQRPSPG